MIEKLEKPPDKSEKLGKTRENSGKLGKIEKIKFFRYVRKIWKTSRKIGKTWKS